MIEDIQCFTVSPTHATLLPGDVLTVTMTYEHHSLLFDGHHSIPLLMKLGKSSKEEIRKVRQIKSHMLTTQAQTQTCL